MKRMILVCILLGGCIQGHFQQPVINAQRIAYHDEMNAHVLQRLKDIEAKLNINSEKPPEEPSPPPKSKINFELIKKGWDMIPVPGPIKGPISAVLAILAMLFGVQKIIDRKKLSATGTKK